MGKKFGRGSIFYGNALSSFRALLINLFKQVFNLTLVELPVMTKVPDGGQPKDNLDMIIDFIGKENCLILAVSPANLADSEAIKLAKKVDPFGDRTIRVITKLDLVAKNLEECVLNNLNLGYIGVVNQPQKSIEKSLTAERKFILTHPSYKVIAKSLGNEFLKELINQHLTKHVLATLPALYGKIISTLDLLEKDQNKSKFSSSDDPDKTALFE